MRSDANWLWLGFALPAERLLPAPGSAASRSSPACNDLPLPLLPLLPLLALLALLALLPLLALLALSLSLPLLLRCESLGEDASASSRLGGGGGGGGGGAGPAPHSVAGREGRSWVHTATTSPLPRASSTEGARPVRDTAREKASAGTTICRRRYTPAAAAACSVT
jgi:hypothetical protein